MKYIYTLVSIILLGHIFLFDGCVDTPIDVPFISSFSPTEGGIGTVITINGTHFSSNADENLVNINGGTCSVVSASPTELVIRTVPGISTGIVSVTVDHLSAVAYNEFTFNSHRLDSINPKTGSVGTKVDFFGVNFPQTSEFFDPSKDIIITFNDLVAPLSGGYTDVNDSTKTFSAIVPEGAVTGLVNVTIGAVTSSYKKDFEVIP